MPERTKITKAVVQTALGDIGRSEYVVSDTQSKGLSLRVRRTGAAWCLRARMGERQTTWTVADAREMPDPEDARAAVAEAWKLIRRDMDPKERLAEIRNGGLRKPIPEKAGWTWEKARDAYLKVVQHDLAEATHRDYRSTLNGRDLAPLHGRMLSDITEDDVKAIQRAVYDRGFLRAMARHVTVILKACLAWAAEDPASGIRVSPGRLVTPMKPGKAVPGHLPSDEEMTDLPFQLEREAISPNSRLAALLIWLTAQRVNTVISARKEHFVASDDGFERLWDIPAAFIKSGRRHRLPLGPAAWDLVKQAMDLSGPGEGWLFPQVRARRKGGRDDGHISYRPVAGRMHPLDPHDIRRAFGTTGRKRLGMALSDVKVVLDHAEGVGGDVTARHYALDEQLALKQQLLQTWEDHLLGLVAARVANGGPRPRTLLLPR